MREYIQMIAPQQHGHYYREDNQEFFWVSRRMNMPASKVKNRMTMLNRKRMPIETSMCAIGLHALI